MGSLPKENEPIPLSGLFYSLYAILKFVALLAAESELGALFLKMRAEKIFQLTLN